jgi:phage shock protein C
MLAGVAAGVADALDADPSIVRVAWALLAILTGGIAFVVYIVMAIVVPEGPGGGTAADRSWGPAAGAGFAAGAAPAPGGESPPGAQGTAGGTPAAVAPPTTSWAYDREVRRAERRARRAAGDPGRGGLIAGLVLIVIGGFFLVREFVPWFDWQLWWPIGLIGLGLLLLAFALRPGRPSS